MPNSIRTTSNTKNTPTLATFKAGDSVLCPSLSFTSFVLTADPYGKRDLLALTHDGSNIYYDDKGYFVPSCDKETGDYQPSLFQDTPANRQAVATLYSGRGNQSSQRTVIDTTAADDDEVVLISAFDLSDIACDMEGAATALDDIGQLLWLIYTGKIEASTAVSMARITHDSTSAWTELLLSKVKEIKEPLAMTSYGKSGVDHE
ncbi:hypothetical protein [Psychrobacter sp. UBA6291]|uniref:hypothetical protein n=1 Tax=Psychrobacter sp. UBA6291 TaxID=1947357 RepID=UPI00257A941D|nr:hypothetical protein [Psychrobacter sp. UBA6291]